ncbi:MAG: hypothetical protein HYW57_03625 [Ignavibacteriales bacterium]|nr:hypothetical protein [Ignavibacteriales bacterium]
MVRTLCLLIVGLTGAQAQGRWVAVSGGMGMNLFAAPAVVDYVNVVAQPGFNERLDEFSSSIEFFVSPEVQISEFWSAGVEYNYVIKSYSIAGSGGISNFTYSVRLPGVIVHYLVPAEGYGFKLGGGLAYAAGTFSEALYGSAQAIDYRSTGAGVKLEAIGVTKFDDHFFGTIALDLRWVVGEVFRNDVRELRVGESAASLDFFAVGLKLGVEFLW